MTIIMLIKKLENRRIPQVTLVELTNVVGTATPLIIQLSLELVKFAPLTVIVVVGLPQSG